MHSHRLATLYVIAATVFFMIDLIWLGWLARGFYSATVGPLLREEVYWPAAVAFYLLYIGGIVLFILAPAIQNGWKLMRVAGLGASLGLLAYGTFDLTALALIQGWSPLVTIVDMAWGAFLTGATSAGTHWMVTRLLRL